MGAVTQAAKDRQAQAHIDLYRWYISRGVCPRCKDQLAEPGKTHCKACLTSVINRQNQLDPTREKRRQYNREHRAMLKAAGLCTYCGKRKAIEGQILCPACKRKNSESQEVYRIKQRLKRERGNT